MNLKELLQSGANINLTVSLDDLRQLLHETVGTIQPAKSKERPPQAFLTRKEVLQTLNIDSSTLWNWEKTGYIRSYPFGGRKRYLQDDVEAIRTGRKGSRQPNPPRKQAE